MHLRPSVTDIEYILQDNATLMSTTDLYSYITYTNDSFVEVSGFTSDELIGQPHNVVRHPDMPVQVFADMWATLKKGEPWTGLIKERRLLLGAGQRGAHCAAESNRWLYVDPHQSLAARDKPGPGAVYANERGQHAGSPVLSRPHGTPRRRSGFLPF